MTVLVRLKELDPDLLQDTCDTDRYMVNGDWRYINCFLRPSNLAMLYTWCLQSLIRADPVHISYNNDSVS